jgi:hypothetical protein
LSIQTINDNLQYLYANDFTDIDHTSFSKYIKEKREIPDPTDPNKCVKISLRELARMINIDYEYFRKIINMNKPTKKRDCIIVICALLKMDEMETNEALNLYQFMPALSEQNKRDALLIELLENQANNKSAPLTITAINNRLAMHNLPELDIIDHKKTSKTASKRKNSPYILLDKQIRTYTDEFMGHSLKKKTLGYDHLTERNIEIGRQMLNEFHLFHLGKVEIDRQIFDTQKQCIIIPK